MTKASIITIGDELLIGQVVDTNSAWMAQQLNAAGIYLRRRVAVGDVKEEIINALNEESRYAEIILITGGLGPTNDDITKPVLREYFGGNMIMHQPSFDYIKNLFEKLKKPLLERNIKQAEVPDSCKVITNKRGSAPGMWFERDGKVFISMPGVPHEMKGMMEDFVIPELKTQFSVAHIQHRTLLTFGVGESFLAEIISEFENSLPADVKLAYLPNFGLVRLRLTGTSENQTALTEQMNKLFMQLQSLVSQHMVSDKDESMEDVVAKILLEKNMSLCTAESCTGGYIAHLLTNKPGSSRYFEGSVISYSYEAKEKLLQVENRALKEYGAVSEQIVRKMAAGALINIGADYVIAVSGIMGPDGGTPDKPVGTVWIAVGNNQMLVTRKYQLRFDRMKNIQLTAVTALNLLREFLLKKD